MLRLWAHPALRKFRRMRVCGNGHAYGTVEMVAPATALPDYTQKPEYIQKLLAQHGVVPSADVHTTQ